MVSEGLDSCTLVTPELVYKTAYPASEFYQTDEALAEARVSSLSSGVTDDCVDVDGCVGADAGASPSSCTAAAECSPTGPGTLGTYCPVRGGGDLDFPAVTAAPSQTDSGCCRAVAGRPASTKPSEGSAVRTCRGADAVATPMADARTATCDDCCAVVARSSATAVAAPVEAALVSAEEPEKCENQDGFPARGWHLSWPKWRPW